MFGAREARNSPRIRVDQHSAQRRHGRCSWVAAKEIDTMNTPCITNVTKSLFACAAIITAMIATSSASAAESTDQSATPATPSDAASYNPISIAFLAGHGEKDAFKMGVGGRAGYTLKNNLYIGGSFVWHFGTQDGPVQAHVSYGGGEVGYELAAGPIVVRPYLGGGIASISASIYMPRIGSYEGGRISASESRFAVWPGASLLVPFDGGRGFIGVDGKFLIVESANAFNAYGTVGVAF
jgi:hypothetical protein